MNKIQENMNITSCELLKLIVFLTAYYNLILRDFIIFILINIIMKICNAAKIELDITKLDNVSVCINIYKIISTLVSLQTYNIITRVNQTYIGNKILSFHNFMETSYLTIKQKVLSGFGNLFMRIIFGGNIPDLSKINPDDLIALLGNVTGNNFKSNIIKPQHIKEKKGLNNIQDIHNFLDSL